MTVLHFYDEVGNYTHTRDHVKHMPVTGRATTEAPPIETGKYAIRRGDQWVLENEKAVPPVRPTPVPQVVSRFQARACLLINNKLDEVEQAVQDSNDPMIQLAWQEAVEWERDSPTINALGAAIGLTQEDLDELFIQGAQIKA